MCGIETLLIKINNFKKWQRPTDKKREWVVISTRFFQDQKIQNLLKECADALPCFLWLLMEANNDGEISVSEDYLNRYFKIASGKSGPKFDLNKRLQALLDSGLIEIKIQAEDLDDFKYINSRTLSSFKEPLKEFYSSFKESLKELQIAETLAPVISTHNYNNNDRKKGATAPKKSPLPESEKTGSEKFSFPKPGELALLPQAAAAAAPLKVVTPKPFLWFQIERPGECYPGGKYSEEEWLRFEMFRKLRGEGKPLRGDCTMQELIFLHPWAGKAYNMWTSQPIEKRLAAYVYAVIEKNPSSPIDYALKAIQDGWNGYEANLAKAKGILKDTLEVKFAS